MAEGHAKLSLCRRSVGIFDAVAAVKLFEETVVLQCGYSYIIPQVGEQEPLGNVSRTLRMGKTTSLSRFSVQPGDETFQGPIGCIFRPIYWRLEH